MRVSVDNLAAALAHVEKIRARTQDFRPFWARLQSGPFGSGGPERGPLPEYMQARWDRRFDLALNHAKETVEERRDGRSRTSRPGRTGGGTYYDRFAPGRRAQPDAPYFEWTGALRAAASGFVAVDKLRATIDPVRHYQGPLESEGGWNATGARFLSDDDVFKPAEFERMVEAALEKWVADEVAQP